MNAHALIDEDSFLAAARARNEKLKPIKKGPAFLFMVPAPKEPSWRDISDWDGVKRLASQLEEQCSTPEGRTQLEIWIRDESQPLIEEGCLALAAVAEIAAQYSLEGTVSLLAAILESDKVAPNVAAIAAQRVRLFRLSEEERLRIWPCVQRWSSLWEEPELVSVMRTIPMLADEESDLVLTRAISEKAPRLLWALALTLTDWSTGQFGARPLKDKYRPIYCHIMVSALQHEIAGDAAQIRDMRVAMLQCLGALTLPPDLDEAARLLAGAFVSSNLMEAAAAVRGAKMLTQRLQAHAITALRGAFQHHPEASFDRFLSLMHNFV